MPNRAGRKGSTEAATAAWAAGLGDLDPPKTVRLREGDLQFWRSVTRARAKSDWTETDLQHAANLARCFADIERISADLVAEGDVVRNDRGTQITNPKHSLLEVLSRRAVMLTRLLYLHAAVLAGRAGAESGSAVAERDAREARRDIERDEGGLLATPMVQ